MMTRHLLRSGPTMRFERLDADEWASGLPSSGFEVFHTREALDVLDRHATGERLLVGGYRGEQLLGMIPLFVRRVAGLRVVSSPPPGMSIPGLGPLVMPTSPKQRKQEKVNREFTSGVLDAIEADDPRTLVRLIRPSRLPRPATLPLGGALGRPDVHLPALGRRPLARRGPEVVQPEPPARDPVRGGIGRRGRDGRRDRRGRPRGL